MMFIEYFICYFFDVILDIDIYNLLDTFEIYVKHILRIHVLQHDSVLPFMTFSSF